MNQQSPDQIRALAFDEAIAAVNRIRDATITIAESDGVRPNYDLLMAYNTAITVIQDARDRTPTLGQVGSPWVRPAVVD